MGEPWAAGSNRHHYRHPDEPPAVSIMLRRCLLARQSVPDTVTAQAVTSFAAPAGSTACLPVASIARDTRQRAGCCRSKALAELCWLWGGVVAAAVYIPLLDGKLVSEERALPEWAVSDVITHLSSFHRQMETEGARRGLRLQ